MPLLSETLLSSLCMVGSSSLSPICFFPPGREAWWWGCQRLPRWGRVCRTEPCPCAIGKAAHCVSHLSALGLCVHRKEQKGGGNTDPATCPANMNGATPFCWVLDAAQRVLRSVASKDTNISRSTSMEPWPPSMPRNRSPLKTHLVYAHVSHMLWRRQTTGCT